jgi:hypothetical protein
MSIVDFCKFFPSSDIILTKVFGVLEEGKNNFFLVKKNKRMRK